MSGSPNVESNVKAAVAADVTKEVSFFVAHPKAIAIGAGIAGIIAGFLIRTFL